MQEQEAEIAQGAEQAPAEDLEQDYELEMDEPVADVEDEAALQSQNAALQAQIEQLKREDQEKIDNLLRAVADAQNQRKRAEADVERERKYGNEKIVQALLPVFEALDLALQHTDEANPALKSTVEGLQNIRKMFLETLEKFGVAMLDPKGAQFDPNLHQAITMVESSEVPANHVLEVMQKGFTLNGRVVKPAMVVVSRGLSPEQPEGGSINIEA